MRPLPGRVAPRSLRARFSLLAVAIAAVAVTLLGTAFVWVLDGRLDSDAHDLLRTRVEAASGLVTLDGSGQLQVTDPVSDVALDAGVWIFRGSTALSRPAGAPDLQQSVLEAVGTTGFRPGPHGTLLYAQALPEDGVRTGTVVGALSLDSRSAAVDTVERFVIGVGVLLMLATYVATRFLVGRALEPVAELTHQAAEWSATDVNRRFGRGRRPTELADLAATLDGVLDRLSAVLRHEQQLTGELSHELRTPLARIVAEVELLQARPRSAEELSAAHAVIAAGAARMDGILQTLLSTARSGADVPPGRSAARDVLTALTASYGDDRLQLSGPPLTVGVEAAVLERIVTPLLDNALRYAHRSVAVRLLPGPVIEIQDDGRGVDPPMREAVFDPGRRGDPDDGHPGAGLGLALSRRLARAAGGDVVLGTGPGGQGTTVTLSLPGG
ncbi:MAG: putative two-component system sensor kinase [Frankiales bacterium]|nr:putative two-component system sensor kinase [Frankiales bacterium]